MMVPGTTSTPLSSARSDSNQDLRSSAQSEKPRSSKWRAFVELIGSDSKKHRDESPSTAKASSAAEAAVVAASVESPEIGYADPARKKEPRRRVNSMTISRASDIIDPAAVAAKGEDEWLKFMRVKAASSAKLASANPQPVTPLSLPSPSSSSSNSSTPKSASSNPSPKSPLAVSAIDFSQAHRLRTSGSLVIIRGQENRDEIRPRPPAYTPAASAAAAAAAASASADIALPLQKCQDRLKLLYAILQEKERKEFNPNFLRDKENYILILDKHELKWVEQKLWSKDSQIKAAVQWILQAVKEAFSSGCFDFSPAEGSERVEAIRLLYLLRDSVAVRKILRDRSIRDDWIKVHYANLFQRRLAHAEMLLWVMQATKPARDKIIRLLSMQQKEEIALIKKEYISETDCRANTLGGVLRPQILEITERLGMRAVLDSVEYDSFVPVLKKIIFSQPDKPYGFNKIVPETFEDYFARCEAVFEGYLNYMRFIIEEDPRKEHSVLEHFIQTAKTPDEARLILPLSLQKSPDFVPCLTAEVRSKLQNLFKSDAFVGCLIKLTENQEQSLNMHMGGLATMLLQLSLRGIAWLAKKELLNSAEAFEFRQSTLETANTSPDWDRLPGILNAIAEKIG